MSQQYARVHNGAFTAMRYTEEQLRFGTTIAVIIASGDEIYPLVTPAPNTGTAEAPVFRDPVQLEIDNKVAAIADLAVPVYQRDMGRAGGVATLDVNGEVTDDQIPDEIVEWLGTWDPRTNTPELVDGVGNIGDTYTVIEELGDVDFPIDLGSGEIKVRGGMSIIYRADKGDEANGRWAVQGSAGLSAADRQLLENSMQKVVTYTLACVPAAPSVTVGSPVFAQLSSANNPYPEYMLVDADGLANVTVNAMSGELHVDTTGAEAGVYNVQVAVGGNLGQSDPITVAVTVAAAV